eukprot:scaffold1878_cov104-Cylindrotheca_fusiformis.AAC.7
MNLAKQSKDDDAHLSAISHTAAKPEWRAKKPLLYYDAPNEDKNNNQPPYTALVIPFLFYCHYYTCYDFPRWLWTRYILHPIEHTSIK